MTERRPTGALLFSVRDRGLRALHEPINLGRLQRLEPAERDELSKQIRQVLMERRGAAPPPEAARPRRCRTG
jgi:hypothetical protein